METCGGVRNARRLPANSQLPRPARQAIGTIRSSRLGYRAYSALRINISLTIGKIYKMVEDFLIQSALPVHGIFGDYFRTSCIHTYSMYIQDSTNLWFHKFTRLEQIERTKLSRKVLYHFAMFTIVNEILTFKHSRIRASVRLLPKIRSTERMVHGPRVRNENGLAGAPCHLNTVYTIAQISCFYVGQNRVRMREITKNCPVSFSPLLLSLYLNKRFNVSFKHLSFKHT